MTPFSKDTLQDLALTYQREPGEISTSFTIFCVLPAPGARCNFALNGAFTLW